MGLSTQEDTWVFWKPVSRVMAGTRKNQARTAWHKGSSSQTLTWDSECGGEGRLPCGSVGGHGENKMRIFLVRKTKLLRGNVTQVFQVRKRRRR